MSPNDIVTLARYLSCVSMLTKMSPGSEAQKKHGEAFGYAMSILDANHRNKLVDLVSRRHYSDAMHKSIALIKEGVQPV